MKRGILLLVIVILISTGCQTRRETSKDEEKQIKMKEAKQTNKDIKKNTDSSKQSEDDVEKVELTMYRHDYNRYWEDGIAQFNKRNEGVRIKQKTFSDNEVMNKKLTTELMAGEGPDIIGFTLWTFKNLHKVFESECFLDLKEYMDDDSEYNMTQFDNKILDSGVFDGKRYFVPYHYFIMNMWTTKLTLEKYNISQDKLKSYSLRDYSKLVKEVVEKNNDTDFYMFTYGNNIESFIINSGIELLDYKNNTANFDTEEFKELLVLYKNIYPSIATSDIVNKYKDREYGMLSDGKTIFKFSQHLELPSLLTHFISKIRINNEEDEIVILPFPSYKKDSKSKATLAYLLGVNNQTEYKKEATDFIKLMISEVGQSHRNFMGSPINSKYHQGQIDEYVKKGRLTDKLVKNIKESQDRVDGVYLIDKTMIDIINEVVKEFIDDKITADEAAKVLQQKAEIYLNE